MYLSSPCPCSTYWVPKKRKSSWFAFFKEAPEDVITALTELGTLDKPTEQVIAGCEKYMCNLFFKIIFTGQISHLALF